MSQPANSTLEHLARLAEKPGVRSTLILSKVDGAIIRSTGLKTDSKDASTEADREDYRDSESQQSAEEVARMAYNFVQQAGEFAAGMQEGDDVQLLRLRTKKNETMIACHAKYLLVVIHDVPKAG